MPELELEDIWVAAAVLLGLQLLAFALRIARLATAAPRSEFHALALADWLNLAGILTLALGAFVGPALGHGDPVGVLRALGLAVILFAGHLFALTGHYELFAPGGRRDARYCPPQEMVALALVAVAAIAYSVAIFRS